jgi:glutathionylspermidine amidase/synthetase
MAAAAKAGLRCKRVVGNQGLSFDPSGNGLVRDDNGHVITTVWKTWSYTTLFGQWQGQPLRTHGEVRVVDVCLNERVRVLEPLWTAIPANKAILPVLSKLFPRHPCVLKTDWEVTDELRAKGYARKPVDGRAGANVTLVKAGGADNWATTPGKFTTENVVYQELAPLPNIDGGGYVQINTFAVAGRYAGTVLRVEDRPIVKFESSVSCLRVLSDKPMLQAAEDALNASALEPDIDDPHAAPFG